MRIGWLAVSALVAAVVLAGCSSSAEPTAESSSSGPDCATTRAAMEGYSVALAELATSLEAGDAMSAVAAADAMSYALEELEVALPGIPPEGQAFLAGSREVAVTVKQSAAQSPQMTGLIDQLTSAFADPAFARGGQAIDAYADQVCPEASPTP